MSRRGDSIKTQFRGISTSGRPCPMPARDDHRRSRWALPALCIADVLVALDGTVVSVALPSIQDDLDFTPAALQWVVTAYTLALGSFLLLGGRVADRVGPRRTLMAGLGVFTAASLVAGPARAPAALLAARAAAGVGAAPGGPAGPGPRPGPL